MATSVLLDAVGEVRDELAGESSVQAPGIVVCGNQSSGKSSVLEALTGVAFPRGDGTVTLRPIVVRTRTEPNEPWRAIVDGVQVNSPEELQKALETNNKRPTQISRDALHVEIRQPSGPELELIDLPGIVRVSAHNAGVTGDEHMHERTAGLVRQYIANPNAVILVVIPITDDLQTSEAIQLAREYDKHGLRTLGVLTKPDHIVDDSARKTFMVRALQSDGAPEAHLKLGYVVVRTRKGDEHGPLSDVLNKEQTLFSLDPVFRELDRSLWGIDSLRARVVDIQAGFLRKFQREFASSVWDCKSKLQAQLDRLGGLAPDEDQEVVLAFFRGLNSMFERVAIRRESGTLPREALLGLHFDNAAKEFGEKIRSRVCPTPGFFKNDEDVHANIRAQIEDLGSSGELETLGVFNAVVRQRIAEPVKQEVVQFVHRANALAQTALATILNMDQMQDLSRKCPQMCPRVHEALVAKGDDLCMSALAFVNDVVEAQADYARFGNDNALGGGAELVGFVQNLELDAKDALISAVGAVCGPPGAVAFRAFMTHITSAPMSISPAGDRGVAWICHKLQCRADRALVAFEDMIPRLVWFKLVKGYVGVLHALQSNLTRDAEVRRAWTDEGDGVAETRRALEARVAKLAHCLSRLEHLELNALELGVLTSTKHGPTQPH